MGDLIPIESAKDARERVGGAHRLERAAARGELLRLRPGAYVSPASIAARTAAEIHRARIEAARMAAVTEPVFSHESAAALHGIPILGEWPDRVHTTVGPNGHSGSRAVERTKRALDPSETMTATDGVVATTPARTAIDLAATRSLLGGIIAISHVRHLGVDLDVFDELLRRSRSTAGVRRARIAVERSTGETESPLETLIWVRCQDLGFEQPELQRVVEGTDGRAYRVDFAWLDGRILLEADGRAKYGALAAGRTPEEVLWEERLRENALRPACDRLLRTTWMPAWHGDELTRLLEAAGVPRPGRRARSLTR